MALFVEASVRFMGYMTHEINPRLETMARIQGVAAGFFISMIHKRALQADVTAMPAFWKEKFIRP